MQLITTIPPYAPFLREIAALPDFVGGRLNTVMPVKEPLVELLGRLKAELGGKELWIDLKCRQIRVSHGFFFKAPAEPRTYTIRGETYILDPGSPMAHGVLKTPPWAELKIDRKIQVDLSRGPVKCYFQDGYSSAYLAEIVDGDTLIMLDGPRRIVGGGESINILDPSLEIEGFFTDLDQRYIAAARENGLHNYMLSYVEQESDIHEMLELDPDARIIAKIESLQGVAWVRAVYPKFRDRVRLMAARGDLYVEVGRPDRILGALRQIIAADPEAVLASRILTSLRDNPRPSCADMTDVAAMLGLGYRTFMVGDDICFNRDMLLLGLDILTAIEREWRRPLDD